MEGERNAEGVKMGCDGGAKPIRQDGSAAAREIVVSALPQVGPIMPPKRERCRSGNRGLDRMPGMRSNLARALLAGPPRNSGGVPHGAQRHVLWVRLASLTLLGAVLAIVLTILR